MLSMLEQRRGSGCDEFVSIGQEYFIVSLVSIVQLKNDIELMR